MQALTGRKVDLAFRVYQALLAAAAGSFETQPMDTHTQVSTLSLTTWTCHTIGMLFMMYTVLYVTSYVTVYIICVVSDSLFHS